MSGIQFKTTNGNIVIPEGLILEIKGAGFSVKLDENGAYQVSCRDGVIPESNAHANSSDMPQAGDVMPDGTICGGISPHTDKPFFVPGRGTPRLMHHWDASDYAHDLRVHGYRDWALPTIEELGVLYANRRVGALAGTFNESGLFPDGYYWSSSKASNSSAWYQRSARANSSTSTRRLVCLSAA